MTLKEKVVKWQQTKDPMLLDEILDDLEGQKVNAIKKYYGSGVSPSVIEAEADRLIIQALKVYNPNRGVPVQAVVSSYLNKLYRFVNDNQTAVRLPENYKLEAGTFLSVREKLKSRNGGINPTPQQLADELKWPVSKVNKMQQMLKPGVSVDYTSFDPVEDDTSLKYKNAIDYAKQKLPQEHIPIFNDILQGKSGNEISKKYKISNARVSQIKNKSTKILQDYLNAESQITKISKMQLDKIKIDR